MIIDVHAHLAPLEISQNRDHFLQNEGAWTDIYRNPKAPMASAEDLIRNMDEEQVDKTVVMGFPWSNEETAKRHNQWLLEQGEKYKGRLYPMASFDILAPWAFKHAEEMLECGMHGLGELALYDSPFGPAELDVFQDLGALCRKMDKVLMVHVNEAIGHKYPGKAPLEITHIFNLIQRCPNTKLLLAHFGGGLPFFASLRKEVKENLEMVRFDTAAMPFLYYPVALKMALKALPAEHFMLGTDFPLLKPGRYQRYLSELNLSPDDHACLMGQSAARFFNI